MKHKRVTIRDVAQKAGVSIATVSYVLNYSKTESISHETRMRVFDAAKVLGYVPNMTAKALTSKRSFLVGIIINMEEYNKKSKIYQYYDLAREMQKLLNACGYDVFLIPTKEVKDDLAISKRRSLDAVFILDMKEKTFKEIAHQFYVPVIFIDGFVDDPLFCKIITDWDAVINKAEEQLGKQFYIVMEDYANKNLLEKVKRRVSREDIFINKNGEDIIGFLKKHSNQPGLVLGELLGMQVENYVDNRKLLVVVHSESDIMLLPDTKTVTISNKEKAKVAVNVMSQILEMEENEKLNEITYIGVK